MIDNELCFFAIIVWICNDGSNTKRAGNNPTRLCKFNRFYPANKTLCKNPILIFAANFEKFFVFSSHECKIS